jgi:DNA-binding MarR family transcriptional regulator
MTSSSSGHQLLTLLAAQLGNPARLQDLQRESKHQRPLDQRALLSVIDDLEAAGWITSKLLVHVTPAGRAALGRVADTVVVDRPLLFVAETNTPG